MNITKSIIFSILTLSILSCSNDKNPNSVSMTNEALSNPNSIMIKTQPDKYSIIMSSTIGISLEPTLKDTDNYDILFKTQNGKFKLWDNNSGVITELGKETKYNGQKIYWTYDDNDKFTEDNINVTISDKTGKTIDTKVINLKADKDGFFIVK